MASNLHLKLASLTLRSVGNNHRRLFWKHSLMTLTLPVFPSRGLESFPSDDVIEFGLLLPKNRADELINLARQRRQTVGQLLRNLIDHALTEERCD